VAPAVGGWGARGRPGPGDLASEATHLPACLLGKQTGSRGVPKCDRRRTENDAVSIDNDRLLDRLFGSRVQRHKGALIVTRSAGGRRECPYGPRQPPGPRPVRPL
jgi:hypothetical protein